MESSSRLHQLLPDELIAKILIDDNEELKAALLSKDLNREVRETIVKQVLDKKPLKSEVRRECCGHKENDLGNRLLELLLGDRVRVGFAIQTGQDEDRIEYFRKHFHMNIFSHAGYEFINYAYDSVKDQKHQLFVGIFELEQGRYWYLINENLLPIGLISRPFESAASDIPDVSSLSKIVHRRMKKFETGNYDLKTVTIHQFRRQLDEFPYPVLKAAYLQMNMIQLNLPVKNQLSFLSLTVTDHNDISDFVPIISSMDEMISKIEDQIRLF